MSVELDTRDRTSMNDVWAAKRRHEDVQRAEMVTVRCSGCGESWDYSTMGYREARDRLAVGDGKCPACEGSEK